MNLINSSILAYFKHITFGLMFFAMVGQTFIQAIACITDFDYEPVSVNGEQDSDEEEKQEETKEEKEEILIIDFNQDIEYSIDAKLNDTFHLSIYSDFNMEINSPPPDFR